MSGLTLSTALLWIGTGSGTHGSAPRNASAPAPVVGQRTTPVARLPSQTVDDERRFNHFRLRAERAMTYFDTSNNIGFPCGGT